MYRILNDLQLGRIDKHFRAAVEWAHEYSGASHERIMNSIRKYLDEKDDENVIE